MTQLNFVTSFNEDIFKKITPYFLSLVKDKWDPAINLTAYSHDCHLGSYSLPLNITYKQLENNEEHELFIKDYAKHNGTENNEIPYNDNLNALKWSHKVFALADKAKELIQSKDKPGWLIWIDADIYLSKKLTKEYVLSILDSKADIAYMETDPFFFAFNLNHQPSIDLLLDLKKAYVSGEVLNYREWTDSFVLTRLINLYKTHGLKIHSIDKKSLDKIVHFKNNYNKILNIRDDSGKRLVSLTDKLTPDIIPTRYKQLADIVRHYKPKSIIETGTWNGGRVIEMALAVFESADKLDYKGFDLFEEATTETDMEEFNVKAHNTKNAVIKRVQEFKSRMAKKNKEFTFSIEKGNTRVSLKKSTADLVLIGGGNSYRTVLNDFNKLKESKIIIFDHFFRKDEEELMPKEAYQGVNKVVAKLIKNKKAKTVVLPSSDRVAEGGYTHLVFSTADLSLPNLPSSVQSVPIHVNPRDCVPKDYIRNNIISNIKNIDKWLDKCNGHNTTAILVSGGPYLNIKELKQTIKDNPNSKVICVKHSYPTLLKNGIKPWGCVVLDPRPITGESTHGIIRTELFKKVDPTTKFFVASMTDTSVLDYIKKQTDNIWGWHAFTESLREEKDRNAGVKNNQVSIVKELGLPEGATLIVGGTCAAMRSIGILHTLGFRNIHFFGFDCSMEEPSKKERKKTTGAEDEKPQPKYFKVTVNEKNFWTTGELLAMAQDCERTFGEMQLGMLFTFHGENTLVAELWKIAQEKNNLLDFRKEYDD